MEKSRLGDPHSLQWKYGPSKIKNLHKVQIPDADNVDICKNMPGVEEDPYHVCSQVGEGQEKEEN